MFRLRLGQAMALAGIVLVVIAQAAAQSKGVAAPVGIVAPIPGAEYLPWVKDVGFPIAAFVLLFWLVRTTMQEHTKVVIDLTVAIRELRVHCSEQGRVKA